MIAWTANGWMGDLLSWQARERLESRREVAWHDGEVRFYGVDREWLRGIGVTA